MSESILITDPHEIEAVRNGEIEGEIYSDGEVYANADSLINWLNEQPIAALEKSAGIES